MRTILRNGTLITPNRVLKDKVLILENQKISELVDEHALRIGEDDEVLDVGGRYIAPGFIDIHSHGGGGHDFMDGTVEAFKKAAQSHVRFGTTSILPTTLTSTMDELLVSMDNFAQAQQELSDGPNLIGLHLEGPYFSLEQKGAQDPRYIKKPDKEEYVKILDASDQILRWTVAPELGGALEMGRHLRERSILGSIGHSDAIYEQVLEAFENGFTHITHLYSGMSMVKRINAYRYAGVVESAYLIDDMTVEIIADGAHLPASLLKLVYKIKGPDHICLVTDSMRGAGMSDGESILGSIKDGQKVIVEDGVAKLPDRTSFAGSVCTTDRLVRTMVTLADVPLPDTVKMMTLTPARVLGIDDKKGSLAIGKDADIVVFDGDIDIHMVLINGLVQYQKGRNLIETNQGVQS